MKKSGVAVGFGVLMVLLGLALLVGALHLSPDTKSFDIDPGPLYYNYVSVGLFSGAGLSGSYKVDGGSSINLYVFTSQDYENFMNGGSPRPLTHVSGSSESFNVTVNAGGTYYIVLEHGAGYESTRQTGTVTHKITGTDVVMLAGSMIVLFVGLLLAVYGAMLRKKEAAEMAKLLIPGPSGAPYFQEPLGPTEPANVEPPISKPPQSPP